MPPWYDTAGSIHQDTQSRITGAGWAVEAGVSADSSLVKDFASLLTAQFFNFRIWGKLKDKVSACEPCNLFIFSSGHETITKHKIGNDISCELVEVMLASSVPVQGPTIEDRNLD